jgi:hypothetical protein
MRERNQKSRTESNTKIHEEHDEHEDPRRSTKIHEEHEETATRDGARWNERYESESADLHADFVSRVRGPRQRREVGAGIVFASSRLCVEAVILRDLQSFVIFVFFVLRDLRVFRSS